ncbi:PLDc_N domain-containing protein [Maribellus luteus]|uniref:PLDc_N domain-containing protein n=1 Tax=Maribellus luteus TaxID=2305463 RepID=A0A399STI1_9BACT|nr:PLD nuclease N-terminal domain-containing protein [Maribellus luteus]RIJ45842.1 PLDc_N domain-containing protein [Maribellus luteus]
MVLLGFIGPQEIIILLILSLLFIFPLIALIDILRSDFEGNNKLIWVIVVIFFNLIGSILYFLIGKNQKLKK